MNSTQVTAFRRYILSWFSQYGRHHLPWRQSFNPYHIMVSEIMLQQTQVDRVVPKFKQFVERFPTLQALATAPTAEVLKNWQGLGYNRRALNLQRAAQVITTDWNNQLPTEKVDLLALPGIGPYTASAIRTFAFNQPEVVIETNIRTVFIYHFFPESQDVSDTELEPFIAASLDKTQPRHWYAALMDYGTHLKSVLPNPTRRSKHYSKQSSFSGSNRQLRGAIVRQLTLKEQLSSAEVLATIPERQLFSKTQIKAALKKLADEGFIEPIGDRLRLKQ